MIDIYARIPINKTSGLVVSQRNCVAVEEDIGREDLLYIITYLERKRKKLDAVLGVTSFRKKKNIMYRYNKKNRSVKGAKNPRALEAWIFVGMEINKMKRKIAEIKQEGGMAVY